MDVTGLVHARIELSRIDKRLERIAVANRAIISLTASCRRMRRHDFFE